MVESPHPKHEVEPHEVVLPQHRSNQLQMEPIESVEQEVLEEHKQVQTEIHSVVK